MNFAIRSGLAAAFVLFHVISAQAVASENKPVAVIVEYGVVEGKEADLVAVLREHARLTREEEPGCLRFEILKPVNEDGSPIPDRLMVSELYGDEAALAAHMKNPRLASLLARIRPMLSSEKVTRTSVLAAAER